MDHRLQHRTKCWSPVLSYLHDLGALGWGKSQTETEAVAEAKLDVGQIKLLGENASPSNACVFSPGNDWLSRDAIASVQCL